jgi:fructose-specific PTS system IIA-like component
MDFQLPFSFPLVNGMHARPASFLRENAAKFIANIRLRNLRNQQDVDAKSVVELMSSDTMYNDECILIINGEDAADAKMAYAWFQDYLQNIFPSVDDGFDANKIPTRAMNNQENILPRILRNIEHDTTTDTKVLRGVAVVAGVNYAKILVLESDVWSIIPTLSTSTLSVDPIDSCDPDRTEETEETLLLDGVARLKQQMQTQINNTNSNNNSNNSINSVGDLKNILHAHLAILEDDGFIHGISLNIKQSQNCATALYNNYLAFCAKLGAMQNEYLRERVIDIQDITIRIINEIYGDVVNTKVVLTEPTIIVADELTPSQFLNLNKTFLKGLVLKSASSTSHTAILARSFAIPTISDLGSELDLDKYDHNHNHNAIIDANRGMFIMRPSDELINYYQVESDCEQSIIAQNLLYAATPAITLDKKSFIIAANIASHEEVSRAIKAGADGVGLFRSEFLFMGQDTPPSEDEQYNAYSQAVINVSSNSVIVRLLDVGGDKPLSYINFGKEENPFLGYRAVRFYKEYADILQTQLRALLRAAIHGDIKIMVPMVSVKAEMVWMKDQLLHAKNQLKNANIPFKPDVQLGMMIEVPSVAFMLDELTQVSDFFSIGTNDLCQYFFACERGNNKVAGLANPLEPSFLRLLRQIITKCNDLRKFVGMCGEMAGNADYLPLLIGLGLDELSMSSGMVAKTKRNVMNLDYAKCRVLLNQACDLAEVIQVEQLLNDFNPQKALPLLTDSLVDVATLHQVPYSKSVAIKKIVSLLKSGERATNCDSIEEALWQREDTYATGIGYGIAIPHCKTKDVASSSICVLRVNNGIDWGSIDGEPVTLILGLIIKDNINNTNSDPNEHLKIIAKLSRQLMKEEFRQALFAASTSNSNNIVELINGVITPST